MVETLTPTIETIEDASCPGGDDPILAAIAAQQLLERSLAGRKESFLAFAARNFIELTRIKFALMSFVVNTLRRRYHRSVLGFAWSLLNPLLTMAVLTAVFSLIFRQDPKAFGVYIFTGLLPWSFFMDSVMNGSTSYVVSEHYLKKVYIPKLFFPLVAVSTEAVNFAFSLVCLVGLAACLGTHINWTVILVLPAVVLLSIFNFSLALFFAVATVYFRDLTHILRVVINTLFYTVPIIYPVSVVPEQYRALYSLHPLTCMVDLFRMTIYQGVAPTLSDWLVPISATFLLMGLALFTLYRTEKDIIFRL